MSVSSPVKLLTASVCRYQAARGIGFAVRSHDSSPARGWWRWRRRRWPSTHNWSGSKRRLSSFFLFLFFFFLSEKKNHFDAGKRQLKGSEHLLSPLTFAKVKLRNRAPLNGDDEVTGYGTRFEWSTSTFGSFQPHLHHHLHQTTTTTSAALAVTTLYKFLWSLAARITSLSSALSMDDNDWDLFAVVRGCLPAPPQPPTQVFWEEGVAADAGKHGLNLDHVMPACGVELDDELCTLPFRDGDNRRQFGNQAPVLAPRPAYVGTSLLTPLGTVSFQFQQQPRPAATRRPAPPSQTPRSKRKYVSQRSFFFLWIYQTIIKYISRIIWENW